MRSQVFVGRDVELTALLETTRPDSGQASIVLVMGDAGIGKTSLIEEYRARVARTPVCVVVSNCSPQAGTPSAFGPIIDIVDSLMTRFAAQASISDEIQRSIGVLSDEPIISERRSGPPLGPSLGLTRLHAGLVQMLRSISLVTPLSLVVEDVQWADPATIDALSFICRKLHAEPISLILTYRPARHEASAVELVLQELRRSPLVTELTLEPLAEPHVARIVEAAGDLPPEQAARIVRLCGGNPFFAVYLSRRGLSTPALAAVRGFVLPAPADLSDVQRGFLLLIAVMGNVSETDLSGPDGDAGASPSLIRSLLAQDLIVVGDGTVEIRHALIRELILAESLEAERIVAHSRAADILLTARNRRDGGRADELAYHLMAAGRKREAVGYLLAAARRAFSMWAFSEARKSYVMLVDYYAEHHPGSTPGEEDSWEDVLLEAAVASRWSGQLDESLEFLSRAEVASPGSTETLARISHLRGQVLWAAGSSTEAVQAQEQARRLLATTGQTELYCEILAALAQNLMMAGHGSKAAVTAQQAIAAAEAIGAQRPRIHAEITAAVVTAQRGNVHRAVGQLQRSLAEARSTDDLELVLRSYGNLSYAQLVDSRYHEVIATAEEAVTVCRRYGPIASLISTVVNNWVSALFDLGRWAEAERVASAALAEATVTAVAIHLRTRLAEVAVAQGRSEVAAALLHELGEPDQNPYALSAITIVRAEAALWDHDPTRALQVLLAALPRLREQEDDLPLLEVTWRVLRAQADYVAVSGTGPRPGPDLDAAIDLARTSSLRTALPSTYALYMLCRAEAARIDGTNVEERWTDAVQATGDVERPYPRSYSLFRLAEHQLVRRAHAAATRSLVRARRIADDLGAQPLLSEISTLSSIGGLRLSDEHARPPTTSPAPFGLTARERQVLSLLVKGATNRLIARTLFISERTVGVHVGNILSKLQVSNRTAAARIGMQLSELTDSADRPEVSSQAPLQ